MWLEEGVRAEEALSDGPYQEETQGKTQGPSNDVWIPVTQGKRVQGCPPGSVNTLVTNKNSRESDCPNLRER